MSRARQVRKIRAKRTVSRRPSRKGPEILHLGWYGPERFSSFSSGSTSTVWINHDKSTIVKKVHNYLQYGVFEREVYWLKQLGNAKGYDWLPKIIGYKRPYIIMSHCGSRITAANKPDNWILQCRKIIDDMRSSGCRHNDIKQTEVLVKNGRIKIIDFQWASLRNDWSCGRRFDRRAKPGTHYNDLMGVVSRAK